MKQIFEYEDYRQFLSDFLAYQKKKRESFSARYFSKVAGFASPNYCSQIVTGKRNLTLKSLPKVLKALKFNGRKATYFEALVNFTQAENYEEQEEHYEKMKKIRKNSGNVSVDETQHEFFGNWHYAAVREVACSLNWSDNYAYLASLIQPKLTVAETKHAVNFLLESKMILKVETGVYKMVDEYLNDFTVPVHIKAKARREVLELGIVSCEQVKNDQRFTTVSTYKVSDNAFKEISEILDQSRAKIGEIVRSDSGDQRVYELVHQLFPISKKLV